MLVGLVEQLQLHQDAAEADVTYAWAALEQAYLALLHFLEEQTGMEHLHHHFLSKNYQRVVVEL